MEMDFWTSSSSKGFMNHDDDDRDDIYGIQLRSKQWSYGVV